MCGIAGIVKTGCPSTAIETALPQMQYALRHRGPDSQGAFIARDQAAGLTHARLSILDLSPAGHQPMTTPDGRWTIAFNGEIYNFSQLRQRLEADGAVFRSTSDTEVILKLYERHGDACVHHLRGMFAFAIWDDVEKTCFIARDRLGIKPLYYYRGSAGFIFASEVRALLASGLIPRQIDPVALWHYLGYQAAPTSQSMIKDIRLLPPGSWMKIDAKGGVTETRYWDLWQVASKEEHFGDHSEVSACVADLLREAVALHLVSDVPVAVFLSGGIDSSAIVALMRETGQTPHTFSVVFSEETYDEAPHARLVAERFRAEHMEITLSEQSLLEQLPEAVAAMDQPTGDGVNTYIISQAVRHAGVKVALSGLGGDEFFGGYALFGRLNRAAGYLSAWSKIPSFLRRSAANTLEVIGRSSVSAVKTAAILRSDGSLAQVYPTARQVLSSQQRRALYTEQWLYHLGRAEDSYVQMLQDTFSGSRGIGIITRVSFAEARTYMHDVLLRDTDQMSMAHGLEVRVPLLDHKLVETLMRLPDLHKRSNGTPKRLLVESLKGLLPDEIVHRPKQGFTLPFDCWMRGKLRSYCEKRLGRQGLGRRGIFQPEQVQRLWQDFLAQRSNVTWSRLWVLVVLEDWLEHNDIDCSVAG